MAGEIAHRDQETGREHDLCDHLRNTAALAEQFGGVFGAGQWQIDHAAIEALPGGTERLRVYQALVITGHRGYRGTR